MRDSAAENPLRKDLEIARHTLHSLSQQHHEACEAHNDAEAGRIQAEIEKLLGVLHERLS
jgi:hypothetical protein